MEESEVLVSLLRDGPVSKPWVKACVTGLGVGENMKVLLNKAQTAPRPEGSISDIHTNADDFGPAPTLTWYSRWFKFPNACPV
jgi:hypothetical protein